MVTMMIIVVVVEVVVVAAAAAAAAAAVAAEMTMKGAIRDFQKSPRCAANCLQHLGSIRPDAVLCKITVS